MKSFWKMMFMGAVAGAVGGIAVQRIQAARHWRVQQPYLLHQTALITGASAGIGAAFARALAREGYNLVLIARRADRLQILAEEIQQISPVKIEIFPADLVNTADLARLEARIPQIPNLAVVINNAGFGTGGDFARVPLKPELDMVRLHVIASMTIMHAALPVLANQPNSALINVSSTMSFLPTPKNATYGATKAFLNSFSQAVQGELSTRHVRIQALCPGFTESEFHDIIKMDRARVPAFLWMTADQVVAESLQGMREGRSMVVPGWANKAFYFIATSLPQSLLAPIETAAWRFANSLGIQNILE